MAEVFLGLGSNRRRYYHLSQGLDALSSQFGPLRLSRVFESESIGFQGSLFLNMVVALETSLSVAELARRLRHIELEHGRLPNAPKYSPRSLDIDILLVDQLAGVVDGIALPRDEVLSNAFVLWPLSELAPDHLHPVCGQSYRQLWRDYSPQQRLWPVVFDWREQRISQP